MTTSQSPSLQALTDARKRDSETKTAKVSSVIAEMLQQGLPISLSGVAARACVSRQFIYSKSELAVEVESARTMQRHIGISGVRASQHPVVGSGGLKADLAHARAEITRLRDENMTYKKQLRRDLGAQLEAADEARAGQILSEVRQELEAVRSERSSLRRTLAGLEQQATVLTEQLAAERLAHQESVRNLTVKAKNVIPIR